MASRQTGVQWQRERRREGWKRLRCAVDNSCQKKDILWSETSEYVNISKFSGRQPPPQPPNNTTIACRALFHRRYMQLRPALFVPQEVLSASLPPCVALCRDFVALLLGSAVCIASIMPLLAPATLPYVGLFTVAALVCFVIVLRSRSTEKVTVTSTYLASLCPPLPHDTTPHSIPLCI